MTHARKIISSVAFIILATCSYGQDSTASINFTWGHYTTDTTLTYQQIVTICDSLFSLAGYPVYADTVIIPVDTTHGSDTTGADTVESANAKEADGSAYFDYLKWKTFWYTRLDAETGKLHNFAQAAIADIQANGGGVSGGAGQ